MDKGQGLKVGQSLVGGLASQPCVLGERRLGEPDMGAERDGIVIGSLVELAVRR